jgi:hypothetical protein
MYKTLVSQSSTPERSVVVSTADAGYFDGLVIFLGPSSDCLISRDTIASLRR